jgi:two-component system NtrC family sensor kinase
VENFGLTAATHIGLSATLTSITTAALGFFVLLRNSRSSLYRVFSLYSFSIALWSAFLAGHVFTNSKPLAIFTGQYLHVGAALIPVTFVHFVTEFFGDGKRWIANLALSILYFLAVVFLFLCLNGTLVSDVAPRYGIRYLMIANSGYVYFVVYFGLCVAWGLFRLFRGYVHAQGLRKNQLKYLLFGSLLGYAGGIDNFLYLYDITIFPLFPYGSYAIPIYVSSTTYAIVQYRLLDINVIIKRSVVYASLLLLLLAPCYLLVIWGQQIAFGNINYTFSMFALLLFITVAFLFPKLRFRTEEAVERVLFQRRVDYRETLLRFSREMVSIVNLENLSNSLLRTVSRAVGTEKASLYLLDETKGLYCLTAKLGLNQECPAITKDDSLVGRLAKNSAGIVKEELEMAHDEANGLQTAAKMGQLEAEITVPIVSKGKLIAILNLGHKDDGIYSNEDIELLSTIANQAAIAIENARLYENLKQSQETLRRADRLSSLGLLTAGLAHEIRNPLVAIRTFTQLLPERYEDAEFREGFQGLALKEVDRICGLINDLLSFARPSRPNVAEENVNDVVDGIARILETEAKEKGVEIKRDFGADLPRIWIDREQMKQVFMNLILNAIQAMRDGGSLFISTRLYSKNESGESGQFLQLEIRDTGVGIPEENLQHIFDPFFTNKDEGSGLGLSISHQIVQEHGGYIVVESKVGRGTSFFINLPVGKRVRPASSARAVNEANPNHR